MKLTHNCPKCGKPAKIQSEFPLGNDFVNYVYQCGHLELRTKINEHPTLDQEPIYDRGLANNISTDIGLVASSERIIDSSFKSIDLNYEAYPFQKEGIKFAEASNLNCLIADAMGLGKTIQALVAMKRNQNIAFPCLAIVKGATLFQWAREYQKWVTNNIFTCIPITNRIHIMPGFDFYIISMDMLAKPDVRQLLLLCGIKSLIIDECQNFKDPSAKRTEGLIELIQLGQIRYKIALSGTPIKNRFNEYGVILNLLAPGYFPNSTIESYWLDYDNKGKLNRLNPALAARFKRTTEKFIIRRERAEVLKNLPLLTRDYQIVEITESNLKNSYNHTIDLFKNYLADQKANRTGINSTELLGWLAKLRAITGQAKCKSALEWVSDFLESTDESLAIGIQHHSVRDTLYYILDNLGVKVLKLSGEDNVYNKSDIVRRFTRGDSRVLVINSLAGGVGLNLQSCAQALVLERQWNSADEEQFESRFHRDGQQKAVTITYMIAKGTIDEFFHEMVLAKRKILLEAGIGNSSDLTADSNFLQELCEKVSSHKI